MVQDFGLPSVGDTGHTAIIEIWETNSGGNETTILDFTDSTLDSQQIIVRDPNGTEVTGSPFTSVFTTDGSDGKIQVVLGDVFTIPGLYTKQGRLTFTGGRGPFHSNMVPFQVLS